MGARTREDALRIMKDSRLGTYGTAALVFGLALRAGATIELVGRGVDGGVCTWVAPIVASGAIGRLAIVIVASVLSPIPDRESLANDVARPLSRHDMAVSVGWTTAASAAFLLGDPVRCASAVLLVAIAAWLLMRIMARRLGGACGDGLGAIAFAGQTLTLIGAVAGGTTS
jgi:adenosylcobinamide-GDP ribazoletransferase